MSDIYIRVFAQGPSSSIDQLVEFVKGVPPSFPSSKQEGYEILSLFDGQRSKSQVEEILSQKKERLICSHTDIWQEFLPEKPYGDISGFRRNWKHKRRKTSAFSLFYSLEAVERTIIHAITDGMSGFELGSTFAFGPNKQGRLVFKGESKEKENASVLEGTIEDMSFQIHASVRDNCIQSSFSKLSLALHKWRDLYDLVVPKTDKDTCFDKDATKQEQAFCLSSIVPIPPEVLEYSLVSLAADYLKSAWGVGNEATNVKGPMFAMLSPKSDQKRVHYQFEHYNRFPDHALAELSRRFPDVIIGESYVTINDDGGRMMWKAGIALQDRERFHQMPESCKVHLDDGFYWDSEKGMVWQEELLLEEMQSYDVEQNESMRKNLNHPFWQKKSFMRAFVMRNIMTGKNTKETVSMIQDLPHIDTAFNKLKEELFCTCHLKKEHSKTLEHAVFQFLGGCSYIPKDEVLRKKWYEWAKPFVPKEYMECNCAGDTYWNIVLGIYDANRSLPMHNFVSTTFDGFNKIMQNQERLLGILLRQGATKQMDSEDCIFAENAEFFEQLHEGIHQNIWASGSFFQKWKLYNKRKGGVGVRLAQKKLGLSKEAKMSYQAVEENLEQMEALQHLNNTLKLNLSNAPMLMFLSQQVSYHLFQIKESSHNKLKLIERYIHVLQTCTDTDPDWVEEKQRKILMADFLKISFDWDKDRCKSNQSTLEEIQPKECSLLSLPLLMALAFPERSFAQLWDISPDCTLPVDVENISIYFQLCEMDVWYKQDEEDIKKLLAVFQDCTDAVCSYYDRR